MLPRYAGPLAILTESLADNPGTASALVNRSHLSSRTTRGQDIHNTAKMSAIFNLQHSSLWLVVQLHVDLPGDVIEQVPHWHHALIMVVAQHKGVGGNSSSSPLVLLQA